MQYDEPSDDARLGEFYWKFLHEKKYVNLGTEVLKKILSFSHGQASAECGFSVNKTLLLYNLSIITLVSQRIIHDHMNGNNLLPNTLEITAPLRRDDKTKKKNVYNGKKLKRKTLNEQIDTVKEKKMTLINTINELHTDADLHISQAEGYSNLEEIKSLLAKSTSCRKTAKEKEHGVTNCNDSIKKLVINRDNI